MWSFHHVGLIELFYESWCLLLWRVGTSPLPASCDCRGESTRRADEAHDDHGVKHTLSVADLPADVLQLIDGMTRADLRLYRIAAARVVSEIRLAENATGMALLCPAALDRFVNATSYVPGLEADIRRIDAVQRVNR